MPRADERRFPVFPRGYIRDRIILANFRIALREQINPDTGQIFTEDEIARITQEGSRYYIEADAIDLMDQAAQQRGLHLADQVDPRTAHSDFLDRVHGPLWVGDKLPATGGSGKVLVRATPGTIYLGSTTLGAPGIPVAADPAGNKYQVLFTATTPAAVAPSSLGEMEISLRAIDAGSDTNPPVGTVLVWVQNRPAGAEPECTVSGINFSGGFDAETDSEYAQRIWDAIRYRAAAGNGAHFRAWAEESSVAIQTAFVYACAYHAGSVHVCVLQRRGSATGPLARIPSVGTLADATAYLVPPNSPVVPKRVHVVVTGPVSQESDVQLDLVLEKGTSAGWADSDPWPRSSGWAIATLASQTSWTITAAAGNLPGGASSLSGANAPQMMAWNKVASRWEKLVVSSVAEAPAGTYTVTLSSAPSFTLAVGTWISPYTDLHEQIAETVEAYFDELGPGELVEVDADVRGARAFRFPRPGRLFPFRVGAALPTRVQDALGSAVVDASAAYSRNEPDLPTDLVDGPNMLTLGRLRIVEL